MDSILTEQAQNETSLLVVGQDDIPNHTSSGADNSIPTQHGNHLKANYPRLRTKLTASLMKLSFLKRCRLLKRPPQSLRVKSSKLIPRSAFIRAASAAETELLESSIKQQQEEIHRIKRLIGESDPSVLLEPNIREERNLQKALDRKFVWLSRQDDDVWVDWPTKTLNKSHRNCCINSGSVGVTNSSNKSNRNAVKKRRRVENRLKKFSDFALASKSVVNLTDKEIPPEAILVLSKRIGFVPTAPHDKLKSKVDCSATMAKLCSATRSRLKRSTETDEGIEVEEESCDPTLPPSLKLSAPTVPSDSGDPLIEGLTQELLAFMDILKPNRYRSNLSASERKGLQWLLKEIHDGDLRIVKADKGGALCIIDKTAMRELETRKLEDTNHYHCLGEKDPTLAAHNTLLNLWRFGEDNSFVSREVCYDVVGLCSKKDGKKQRASTSPVFKPGTAYFYVLLKIHKLDPSDLVPGVNVPIRLVNDLSQSVTSRSDKYLNWKFLQPLQSDFCQDLVKDSSEALRWLESLDSISSIPSTFSWDFESLYDNLSPDFVLKALRVAIKEHRSGLWTDHFVNWLLDLVSLSLDSSFGKLGKYWYKGISGIATGGSLSVSLANIAVFYALRLALEGNTPVELVSMKRFVDDLTGLWRGPHDLFFIWADSVNAKLKEVGLSLKSDPLAPWDVSPPGVYSVFLDIKYMFDAEGVLQTDINIKETDARVYLHFSSFHPRQTFPSIVYSQCLRYKRVINNGPRLIRRLLELKDCFLRSGYPKKMIDTIIADVLKRPRNLEPVIRPDKPPAPVMWVHTYGAQSDVIKQLVAESNKIIKQSPAWKDEPKPMQMVCRRPKNLGDQLLQRKRLALTDSSVTPGTVRCTPLIAPGSKGKRGRRCKSCSMMSHK